MQFTLDQLRALDAVERTGSFAAAAAELHKVPSAISYSVRGLEDALGVELFDRRGRRAELTSAGRAVLELGRDVLERAAALQSASAELASGWEPELHVVADGALPLDPLLRCLRVFADPAVPTALRLDVEYQEGVIDRFLRAPADVALVLGLAEQDPGFRVEPLPDLELVLVVAPDHPLARGPATERARSRHAELVVRDSSPRYAQRSKGSFLGSGNLVFLSDFHSKRHALLEAAGYGWIPRHLVAEDLEAGRLRLLDADPCRWTYHPRLVTRADREPGRAERLFVEALTGSVRP